MGGKALKVYVICSFQLVESKSMHASSDKRTTWLGQEIIKVRE